MELINILSNVIKENVNTKKILLEVSSNIIYSLKEGFDCNNNKIYSSVKSLILVAISIIVW